MEDTIIQIDTAKLALEKEFNCSCITAYFNAPQGENPTQWSLHSKPSNYPIDWNSSNYGISNGEYNYISAPTQSLLQKWLRKIHKIEVFSQRCEQGYSYQIYTNFGDNTHLSIPQNEWCNTYEEALELGLNEGLKLVNTQAVPDDIFKLAKENGFKIFEELNNINIESATYYDLKKWLKNVHNRGIQINYSEIQHFDIVTYIFIYVVPEVGSINTFMTYKDALDFSLRAILRCMI